MLREEHILINEYSSILIQLFQYRFHRSSRMTLSSLSLNTLKLNKFYNFTYINALC